MKTPFTVDENDFESLKSKLQDQGAIRFSIWFHDAIYDTKRNDNEEQSARLASEVLNQLHIKHQTIEGSPGISGMDTALFHAKAWRTR